jgi:predicted metal-dependent hydrolase
MTEQTLTSDEFKREVRLWADRVGVEVKEIHVRPMTKKWGSCSTTGRLTFSTDLLSQDKDFITEKIVHEVLHLKIPKHGKVFKATLRAYLGRYGGGW